VRRRGRKQKPIPSGNRLKFNPKIYAESPTPKYVENTLSKLRENGNSDELSHGHNLDTIRKIPIKKGLTLN
jgi:hypothetical protein